MLGLAGHGVLRDLVADEAVLVRRGELAVLTLLHFAPFHAPADHHRLVLDARRVRVASRVCLVAGVGGTYSFLLKSCLACSVMMRYTCTDVLL